MRPSTKMAPAVIVALFAGALRAAQLNAPQALVRNGVDAGQLSAILPALSLLSLAVSPVAAVAAGYVWGTGADVRRRWPTFVGATFAAAVAGFVVVYLPSTALLLLGSSPTGLGDLVGQFAYHVTFAIGLVNVALVALAGSAVAEFRSSSRRRTTAA